MTYVTNKRSLSALPWIIWGLGTITFFVEYLIRVSPTSMVPSLMESFHASSTEISTLAAYFLYAYVAMQIPVGILVDRFGSHLCLALSTLLCAGSIYLFASTEHLHIAQLARFLFGLGAAFALVGTLKLAANWFKPQQFSILVGTTQALGMVGGAFGAGIMGRLVEAQGWKQSTLLFALILAVIALLLALIVRNGPEQNETPPVKILSSLKVVFKSSQTWLISIFSGLLFMPTVVFAELWGSFYLITTHNNIGPTTANDGIGLIFMGWAMGGPLAGLLANRFGRQKVMMFSALSGVLLIPCILYLSQLPILTLFILLFLFGFFNSGMVVAYTAVTEINPKQIAGVALGFANGLSVVVGAFCQQWVGVIIDFLREKRDPIGTLDYTAGELKIAMTIIFIGVFIAWIMSFFIKETLHLNRE